MKLLTKLTLTSTFSKIAIVILFILLLPALIDKVAFETTNRLLKQQEKKVLDNIRDNGVDYYLQGDVSYGSYTLLKEEYISLEKADSILQEDTIQSAQRIIENDTLMYRILSRSFEYQGQNYFLEIGKTIASISQYNAPLQRIALYVLVVLILLTLLIDLFFTRFLLRPLQTIINTKLKSAVFPFKQSPPPIKTSTLDFKQLDETLIGLMKQVRADFEREREFTSNASHELMTPVSILQSKLENLMLNNELDERAQEKILEMMKTLARLKKIVHSLLLISRIENEQYARMNTIQPKKIIGDVTEELAHRLEEKNIKLEVNISSNESFPGYNEDLVFQLFYNLINNAIRYNKEGGNISISDKPLPGGNYVIRIKDTGIGIAAQDIDFIFHRFRKKNADGEGYGLGLAIVKTIADFHNMQLKVTSTEGEGTEFSIIFPASGK